MRCLHAVLIALLAGTGSLDAKGLRVLFLGDEGHHRPADRAKQLIPVLAPRGIDIEYTDRLEDLSAEKLADYDGLIIFANHGKITPEAETALLDYVASGRGFIPIHCASYCFLNSPAYVALVGAQFKSHGAGVFDTKVVDSEHPTMQGLWEFSTWDETYVHTKHASDRRILQVREDGGHSEPWTWVRRHGEGRVFYTAYGHDERTWGNPAFHALVERGVRWACGSDEVIDNGLELRQDVAPFEYQPAEIPNYLPGKSWGVQGDLVRQMQKPLEPGESSKHLVVADGLEVELFASEPDIFKPICMAWDARGRLWIAETEDYPNSKRPDDQGHDQIKICEDTDGDGRADRFTVFADKLSIPTSLAFARGGVVVHQAPHTLFLKDTDGDDRADVREILFTGWSTSDTHAGPSNLRYGFDNWLYGMVGYAGFRGTVGGEEHRFSTGFYRFRPNGSKLEFLRNTDNNSWGVSFTEEGVLFGSTANGNPSVYLPIPNRFYDGVRGWSSRRLGRTAISAKFYPITDKVRQVDHFGSFTAAAGHAIYTARLLPEHYWNRSAFVAGPTGHLLATFLLEPVGADYVTRNSWNILASDDEWTAPISGEVGPDGAVWVIDWYNYIVQHNPTPQGFKNGPGNAYVTDLRDKVHGRVYRIAPRDSDAAADVSRQRDLSKATAAELVASLEDDNLFWRLTAQRLLVERGERDVVPALIALARSPQVDSIGIATGAVHAIRTLEGLGALEDGSPWAWAAVAAACEHPSAAARRNALEALPRDVDATDCIVRSDVLLDEDGQVRLAAYLALAESPPSEATAAAIAHAIADPRNAEDRWIPDAATSAAARQGALFLTALASHPGLAAQPRVRELVTRVAEHVARGDAEGDAARILAALAETPVPLAGAIAEGVEKGWSKDREATLADRSATLVPEVLGRLDSDGKARFLRLASRWKIAGLSRYTAEVSRSLAATLESSGEPEAARISAARQLVEFRPDSAEPIEQILGLIGAQTPPELAKGLLAATAASDADATADVYLQAWTSWPPSVRRQALEILLSRPAWTRKMLDAADAGDVDLELLSLDRKQALAKHPDKKIAARAQELLARKGGLPSADRQAVVDSLLSITEERGDPKNGKVVYTKLCAKCHRLHGEGEEIGPDLTGMAAHPKAELLVHILDPNRSVEGNFRQYTVIDRQGTVRSGLLASESRNSIEVIDTEGKRHAIQREDIVRLDGTRDSLMPEGFEKQTTREGLRDLLELLTQRGKYLPLPLDKVATIASDRGMFFSRESRVERLVFPDWKPKVFQGVPFHLVDPQDGERPNVVLLHGPNGTIPPTMPKSVRLPCNARARAIHLLSGVGGWCSKGGGEKTVSMVVRLHLEDGGQEDHELRNGEHFADYIGVYEVPGSQLAYKLRGQQIRYLAVYPKTGEPIREIEFLKGRDHTAPIVMAVTIEGPEA